MREYKGKTLIFTIPCEGMIWVCSKEKSYPFFHEKIELFIRLIEEGGKAIKELELERGRNEFLSAL